MKTDTIIEYCACLQQQIVDLLAENALLKRDNDSLKEWLVEASSAFRLDGGKDTLEEALSLVYMCHEGAKALDMISEINFIVHGRC